ncbi:MAG: T9SS type A sorting domain-containing protein, partial [Saprospiraceae bacterium]|nr:T9SS type A sorting domain-containing protein [Saprospiraceae bacterium]
DLAVNPNPSAGPFDLSYTLPEGLDEATMEVYHVTGILMDKIQLSGQTGTRQFGASYPTGIYLVKVQAADQLLSSIRVVKEN